MRTASQGVGLGRDDAPSAPSDSAPFEDERDETPTERLDRNTIELLNELRVAGTGIQVLFAFLLIVPFNTGFRRVSSVDRYVYFVTLLCIAAAAALLIAPSIQHRLLFRHGEKAYLVRMGTRVTILAAGFLCAGLTGILVLVSDVVFGVVTAAAVGVVTAAGVAGLWFVLPLRHLRRRAAARGPSPRSLGTSRAGAGPD